MTGNNWVNINCGGRGINDYGSGILQFRALRVISHATSKVPGVCSRLRFRTVWHAYHSSARLPQLGLLTTAPLAKYNSTGRNSTPFFFAFHHTPIALDVSYLLSSTLRATSSPPSSSTSYSSYRIVLGRSIKSSAPPLQNISASQH